MRTSKEDSDIIIGALRSMREHRPTTLLADINYQLSKSGFAIDEAELIGILTQGDVNARERREFHTALALWDKDDDADWSEGTSPSTDERRSVILRCLGFTNPAAIGAINAACPPVHETPVVIAEPRWEPWYRGQRRHEHAFYWPAYMDVLARKLDPESIANIDRDTTNVVSRLADPTAPEPFQAKGLVVGHVQSGKTANFTGVLAKAIDAGYRLVIVLTGTVELLRAQTQRRLDMELVGRENILGGLNPATDQDLIAQLDYAGDGDLDWLDGKFVSYGADFEMMPGIPGILRLTGRSYDYKALRAGLAALDFRKSNELRDPRLPVWDEMNLFDTDVRLVIAKKNKSVLTKLINDLRSVHVRLDEIPTLIIDDEADQASVNTLSRTKQEAHERTAINGLIAQLLRELGRAQYVGYTATPFANVFISPEDSEDIFPKDFIISLDPPPAYMGGRAFHDLEGVPAEDVGNPAVSNEAAFVRNLCGFTDAEADKELQQALDDYVVSGAIKLWRSAKANREPAGSFRHHTMLVHESVKMADHAALAERITTIWRRAGYDLPQSQSRLRARFEDFQRVTSARNWSEPSSLPTEFTELLPYLGQAVDLIRSGDGPVTVVNGDKDSDYQQVDFDSGRVWRVLVGGTKLSRGFTIEGLTITYYKRRAFQADTLMQMGRWFGYRQGYRDLVRLYIARNVVDKRGKEYDLYEAFEAIVKDEEEFRAQLKQFATVDDDGEPLVRPSQVPPLVFQQLPWLKPTSVNKMYNAELDFEGVGGQLKDFPRQPERGNGLFNVKHFEAVKRWLGLLGPITEFEYHDPTNNRLGRFNARTCRIDAGEMLEALRQFSWVEDFTFEPTLRMIEHAMAEGHIKDWAVVIPYLDRAATRQVVGTEFEIPVLKRTRRDGTRGGFSGSSFRQRDALERIAGNMDKHGGHNADALYTPTRGSMLLTFAADPAPNTPREPSELPQPTPPADIATLFSLVIPKSAAPKGRIGFRVKDPRHRSAVIVPVTDVETPRE